MTWSCSPTETPPEMSSTSAAEAARDGGDGLRALVGARPRAIDLGAGALGEQAQHDAVGLVDPARAERRARLEQLVARGEDRDARAAAGPRRRRRPPRRARRARATPTACRRRASTSPAADVLAAEAHVAARGGRRRRRIDAAVVARSRPRSCRTASAPGGIAAPVVIPIAVPGPTALAATSPAATAPTRRSAAGRGVGGAHRVAVHRRAVEAAAGRPRRGRRRRARGRAASPGTSVSVWSGAGERRDRAPTPPSSEQEPAQPPICDIDARGLHEARRR